VEQGRRASIDALRGFAILFVLQFHLFDTSGAYSWLGVPSALQAALSFGWTGVNLFFVLSAYLLTSNLLRHRGEPQLTITFYKRRALRILPLYWLLLFVGFGLNHLYRAFDPGPETWLWSSHYSITSYLLFLQNWILGYEGSHVAHFYAPTWSLAVEEQFYLVLPVIGGFLSKRVLLLISLVSIVLAPALRLVITTYENGIASYVWTLGQIDAFGWGMLIALLPPLSRNHVMARRPMLIFSAATITGTFTAILLPSGPLGTHNIVAVAVAAFLSAIATVTAINLKTHGGSIWRPFNKALIWSGQRCYSIYLLHMPIFGLGFLCVGQSSPQVHNMPQLLVASITCVFTLLLADVTYRRIEVPLMKLAERIASYRTTMPVRNASPVGTAPVQSPLPA
jgi:peptidoglycan/LPS O-acetylase OafA/YrhL